MFCSTHSGVLVSLSIVIAATALSTAVSAILSISYSFSDLIFTKSAGVISLFAVKRTPLKYAPLLALPQFVIENVSADAPDCNVPVVFAGASESSLYRQTVFVPTGSVQNAVVDNIGGFGGRLVIPKYKRFFGCISGIESSCCF